MTHLLAASAGAGPLLLELGAVLLALALLGRLANRVGLPTIPLYLIAGVVMGEGTAIPLEASREFIAAGADLGVVILLLLLGIEYTPTDLRDSLTTNWPGGLVDLLANLTPGVLIGLLLGWSPVAALVLGGVTYISSSGIISRQLTDLDRVGNRETSVVLAILVIEDLAMALYLPLIGVLVLGVGLTQGVVSMAIALVVVAVALWVASTFGGPLSRLIETRSRETLLLTVLGLTFLVGGLVEGAQVSAAVGAFLVGLMLSGSVAERGRELLLPVRDVFGGLFFLFFGLQVDPSALPPVVLPALALALVTTATKVGTGWWSAARSGIGRRGRMRAAMSLVPRGEFSIVIAGLAVGAGVSGGTTDLGALAACYVLIMAVGGSLLMRFADQLPLPPPRRAVRTG